MRSRVHHAVFFRNDASLQRAGSQRQLVQVERLRAIGREGQPHLGKRRLEVGELDRQRPHGALEIVIHFSEDPGQDLPMNRRSRP